MQQRTRQHTARRPTSHTVLVSDSGRKEETSRRKGKSLQVDVRAKGRHLASPTKRHRLQTYARSPIHSLDLNSCVGKTSDDQREQGRKRKENIYRRRDGTPMIRACLVQKCLALQKPAFLALFFPAPRYTTAGASIPKMHRVGVTRCCPSLNMAPLHIQFVQKKKDVHVNSKRKQKPAAQKGKMP